jgi:hypothetical protein
LSLLAGSTLDLATTAKVRLAPPLCSESVAHIPNSFQPVTLTFSSPLTDSLVHFPEALSFSSLSHTPQSAVRACPVDACCTSADFAALYPLSIFKCPPNPFIICRCLLCQCCSCFAWSRMASVTHNSLGFKGLPEELSCRWCSRGKT